MNYEINKHYKHLNHFILKIQDHFKKADNSLHKARNEIKVVNHENQAVVVKSFKVPHLLNKIIYTFFRSSKTQKSYEYSLKIAPFAPTPIAYIEFKKFRLLEKSYFVSEHFDYDFTIREPLLNDDFEEKEKVLKAFSQFTYALHEKGILHLDYSPGNILIKKENGDYTFKVVDINRMKFKTLSLDERLKNFSMLWANDADMKIIATEYALLSSNETSYCIEKAIHYSQKLKDFKNMKKRLKGKKVVD
jgi:serine/threonine protein kinase